MDDENKLTTAEIISMIIAFMALCMLVALLYKIGVIDWLMGNVCHFYQLFC